ncbi:hypothetical protein GDO81_024211 [Engystomops pustulosus]|uniref:Uncharacterized protein n=1 Tax=Engystomops pustulosus TaxID=76066 RepID=A0AAV6YQV9_ENGPU|nr:hypothetical protein GDO81_024211 [Engystomops pustulosus]
MGREKRAGNAKVEHAAILTRVKANASTRVKNSANEERPIGNNGTECNASSARQKHAQDSRVKNASVEGALPKCVRLSPTFQTLKCNLKTLLFRKITQK